MPKNYGIGVVFSAEDRGFVKQSDKAADSLEKIDEASKNVSKNLSANRLNALVNTFQSIQLGNISDKLQDIGKSALFGDQASTTVQKVDELSDAMSQVNAAFVGSAKAGKLASQLIGRFTGKAGATVEEAATAVNAFRKNMDIEGMQESMEDFFEMMQLGGGDFNQFSEAIGRMRKGFNLTRDDAKFMVGSFLQVGGATGQAKEALDLLPSVTETISESFNRMGVKATAEEFQQAAIGTVKLASSMKRVGIDMGRGGEIAKNLITQFAGMNLTLEDMRIGLGGNLDEFVEFGKGGIGLRKTLDLIKQSPADAAMEFANMAMSMRDAGPAGQVRLERFRRFIADKFGPDFSMFIDKVVSQGTADVFKVQVPKNVKEASKAMNQFTSALGKSGKVMEKRLEAARDAFDRQMGAIGLSVGDGRRGVIKRLNMARKSVRRLANEDSLKGTLFKSLVALKTQGIMGIAPTLEFLSKRLKDLGGRKNSRILTGLGDLAGGMKDRFGDLSAVVDGLGISFGDIGQAFLVTAAISETFGIQISDVGRKMWNLTKGMGHMIFRLTGLKGATVAASTAFSLYGGGIKGALMATVAFTKSIALLAVKLVAVGAVIGSVAAAGMNAWDGYFEHNMRGWELVGFTVDQTMKDVTGFILGFFGTTQDEADAWVDNIMFDMTSVTDRMVMGFSDAIEDIGDFFSDLAGDAEHWLLKIGSLMVGFKDSLVKVWKDLDLKTLIFGSAQDKARIAAGAMQNFQLGMSETSKDVDALRSKQLKERDLRERQKTVLRDSQMLELRRKQGELSQRLRTAQQGKTTAGAHLDALGSRVSNRFSGVTGIGGTVAMPSVGGVSSAAVNPDAVRKSRELVQKQITTQEELVAQMSDLNATVKTLATAMATSRTSSNGRMDVKVGVDEKGFGKAITATAVRDSMTRNGPSS